MRQDGSDSTYGFQKSFRRLKKLTDPAWQNSLRSRGRDLAFFMAADATRRKLFKSAAIYFPLIAQILPRALQHRYTFVSDEWFRDACNTGKLSVAERNHIVVLDVLEKSHLAAVSTLIRIERWADAVCIMHDTANFPGFASAMRGLIENGGDSIDGLLNIASSLAENRKDLSRALAGEMKADLIGCAEIERPLDHYVHARW